MDESEAANAWRPTERQLARAERSKALLRPRLVPVFRGPLYVGDDDEVLLRDGPEVVRRLLVLWAVVLRAEGIPREEALHLIERLGLGDAASPEEERFLRDPDPAESTCMELEWRLESVWVLLWSLGCIEALDWPRGMCDVPRLVELMRPFEEASAPAPEVRLRPKAEILDEQDLILRIHWAIRDAWVNGRMIPQGLDWSAEEEHVPAQSCAVVGVVEQRHHTLNWLVRFLDADWDDVDTPT